MSMSREIICLKRDAFAKMSHLRYIYFYCSTYDRSMNNKMQLPSAGLYSFPKELRYLDWLQFPMKSLPSKFNPENLVVLKLRDSKVKKLWKGTQNLVKLKEVDLSSSKYLTRIPDLSKATMIEKILLYGCESLEEVHSSIQYLNTLEILHLGNCHNLLKLPSKIGSKVLNCLYLINCPRIKRWPEYRGENLKLLGLDFTAIKDATSTLSSILRSSALVELHVVNCGNLSSLPDNFYELKSLRDLYLDNWSELERLPEILEAMENLYMLSLTNCGKLKSLPNSICNLKSLRRLRLDGSAIKEIPSSIEHLSCLVKLNLSNCKYLESLPTCIHRLPVLEDLNVKSCQSLHSLPELPPSLQILDASNCSSLNTISSFSFIKYCNLGRVKLSKCLRLHLKTLVMEAQYRPAKPNSPDFFRFFYSGCEVPGWFSNQSMGASITVQFPSNLDQFKAIAFCIVFKCKKLSRKLLRFDFDVEGLITVTGNIIYDSFMAEMDNVLVWSCSPEIFDTCSGIAGSVNFRLYAPVNRFGRKEIGKHCEIKKCGFCLLQY